MSIVLRILTTQTTGSHVLAFRSQEAIMYREITLLLFQQHANATASTIFKRMLRISAEAVTVNAVLKSNAAGEESRFVAVSHIKSPRFSAR